MIQPVPVNIKTYAYTSSPHIYIDVCVYLITTYVYLFENDSACTCKYKDVGSNIKTLPTAQSKAVNKKDIKTALSIVR